MSSKKKQKRIRKTLDSGRCPCPTCNSQDLKKEGEDDFEVSDDLDSEEKRDRVAKVLGQELPNIIEDLIDSDSQSIIKIDKDKNEPTNSASRL